MMTQREDKCLWITLAVTEEKKPGNGKSQLTVNSESPDSIYI